MYHPEADLPHVQGVHDPGRWRWSSATVLTLASAVETWVLSTDPDFITKVHDVVGLYMSPPEHALVLAADEKS